VDQLRSEEQVVQHMASNLDAALPIIGKCLYANVTQKLQRASAFTMQPSERSVCNCHRITQKRRQQEQSKSVVCSKP
jgi:hypothetical protein